MGRTRRNSYAVQRTVGYMVGAPYLWMGEDIAHSIGWEY